MSQSKENRYDENSFYFSITENMWCWKKTATGEIFKAKTKSELLKIKNKKFIGSGNYHREYKLDKGAISTEEFGKLSGVGSKEYVSMLLKRGTTPLNKYENKSGGQGVHKPENRRKKGLHFIDCLQKSKISYDRVLNQFNTYVWVFKNVTDKQITLFKHYWK
tara:strand:+ start:1322 stop:1807 length:486 start_codon:yes stop_codon:yes gene_type:complete